MTTGLYVAKFLYNKLMHCSFEWIKKFGQRPVVIKFSPLRRFELIIGFQDSSLIVFDIGLYILFQSFCIPFTFIVETKSTLSTLRGHQYRVHDIAVHPLGSFFVSCSKECLNIWDFHNFTKIKTMASKTMSLSSVVFAFGGETIVTSLANEIFIWKTPDCELEHKFTLDNIKDRAISLVAVSPNNEFLIAGGKSNELHIWNLKTREFFKTLKLSVDSISKLSFTTDSKHIILLSESGKLLYIEMNSFKVHAEIEDTLSVCTRCFASI